MKEGTLTITQSYEARRLPQYLGGYTACILAFCSGNILGWTSPAEPRLLNGEYGFNVTKEESSWIGALLPVGAAVSCVPSGYLTDYIGRRFTLLGIVPVFLLGYVLMIWATSVSMLCVGRFIGGMCSGAISVVAPVYVAEICQKEIRGALGTLYQLLIASGIMFVYVIGSLVNVFWLTIICAVFPIIFGITFIFFPETPVYYLSKNKPEEAKSSLRFFRGVEYDLEAEYMELQNGVRSVDKDGEVSHQQTTMEVFKSRQGVRSLGMSVGMQIFQQLSGINAVIFYTTTIFQEAGSTLDPSVATIIIGVVEVSSTIFVSFLVDRLGRKILLLISSSAMGVCVLIVGIFFYLKDNGHDVLWLGWLPLTSLCVYIVMFSIGYGPIPWAMMPEILPTRIKGVGSSIASEVNWICCFLVTKLFSNFVQSIGTGPTYWIFTAINALGTVFGFFLIETKGKSFEEIQQILGQK